MEERCFFKSIYFYDRKIHTPSSLYTETGTDISAKVAHLPGFTSWWCHQMETFSALLALCAGNSPVTGEFPSQRPVTRRFDVFYDLRLNKRWSKQLWGWWFQTPSCSLWRHCNVISEQWKPCYISPCGESPRCKCVDDQLFVCWSMA